MDNDIIAEALGCIGEIGTLCQFMCNCPEDDPDDTAAEIESTLEEIMEHVSGARSCLKEYWTR